MAKRHRSWWNIFGKFWDSIMDSLAERIPQESSLKTDAERMLEVLDMKADAASFTMARADEMYERLLVEIDNHDALGRQAELFLRDEEEEATRRCVALQLQAGKEVSRLKTDYEVLQREAEQMLTAFLDKKSEVDERLADLPKLQADMRLIRAQEKIQRTAEQLSLEGAETSFDQTAREVRIRKLQLQNRELLTADPQAELDRRIRASLGDKQIEGALQELRLKISEQPIEVEVKAIAEDPVVLARKVLEAPRYAGLLTENKRT
jgi:phage shock protein A